MSKKTSLKSTTSLVIIFLLLAFIGLRIFSLIKNTKESKRLDNPLSTSVVSNYSKERAYWKAEINNLGTEKAYKLFKEDSQNKDFGLAHALAHIFGELIYEKEGIEGFIYCDNSFSYGCYHSFFGMAVTYGGIDVVPKLAQVCLDQWQKTPACPHGIGHGILGYLGDDELLEALKVCASLPSKVSLGCGDGIFMEYNFHIMKLTDGSEVRVYDPEKSYEPCSLLPEEFREACYFSQPQWWSRVLGGDYAHIGRLCAALPESTESRACFSGVGDIVPSDTSYDVSESIRICNLMPDDQGKYLCRKRTSWVFYAEAGVKAKAYKLCEGLDTSRLVGCAKKSDFVAK